MTSLPGYGPSVPKPSAVTAIIAGILAIIAGCVTGFEAIVNFLTLALAGVTDRLFGSETAFGAAQFALGVGALAGAVALLIGGGCLPFGRRVGVRPVVIGGLLAALVSAIPVVVLIRYVGAPPAGVDARTADFAAIEIGILAVAAVAALTAVVLALLPSTRRYCAKAAPTS
jgi:hypothetical protein